MTFADLQSGEAIFVDANTLIYHFTNHAKFGAPCTALERIELKDADFDRVTWLTRYAAVCKFAGVRIKLFGRAAAGGIRRHLPHER